MNSPLTATMLRQETHSLLRAPRRMPVAEAVKKYMRIPTATGNGTPWDPEIAPYIIEPMNSLSSRDYDAVIFVGPSRTGKTLGLIDGWIVYNIVCDPADMLVVQITRDKAQEHAKKRLARTFRISPEVAKRLSPRRNDNNILDKYFLSGSFLKMGWPSINLMSSSDFKYIALTDYDRFPENIDGEGDGFTLASKRTTTYMSAGMTLVESSPGRDIVDSKWQRRSPHEAPPATGIMSLYNRGDRRRWYWPCPHCHDYFQPIKIHMTGYQNHPDPVIASESAKLQCPHCLALISPAQKRQLNTQGIWLIEGQQIDKRGRISGNARRSRIASFWMEGPAAAYQTWAQLVYKLLTAEQEYQQTGSEETLKAVFNTDWGLAYSPKISQAQRKSDSLSIRAEYLERGIVPDGVRFMVASVDIQGGKQRRFVVLIMGYGERGERWIIDHFDIQYSQRINADGEAQPIHPGHYLEDWEQLRGDLLDKAYPLAGHPYLTMRIYALGIDCNGEEGVTDNAYKFWRSGYKDGISKRLFLLKGDGYPRDKLITTSYPDRRERRGQRAKHRGDVPIYLLQTNALKDRIAAALGRDTQGPNYIHFPHWLGECFYDQLTYEERDSEGKWHKPGKGANEAFDLMVYAQALVILLGYDKINWQKPPQWTQLAAQACTASLPAATPAPNNASTSPTKKVIHSLWTPLSSRSAGWR